MGGEGGSHIRYNNHVDIDPSGVGAAAGQGLGGVLEDVEAEEAVPGEGEGDRVRGVGRQDDQAVEAGGGERDQKEETALRPAQE